MARQELEIVLRAENRTKPAFTDVMNSAKQVQGLAAGLGNAWKTQSSQISGWASAQVQALGGVAKAGHAAMAGLLVPSAVIAGLGLAGKLIYELGQHGSDIQGVTTAFGSLTAAIGGSAPFIAQARTATKGLLTDYDLMLNANRLLAARIPVTGEQFGEMARQAIALGRSVGKDARESVERLAMGLSKLEAELLDEINVKVSATDATKRYADQIGKAAKDLTAYERQIAFVNAVSEQMQARTAELGDVQLTFRDRITIATNAIKNQYDNLALAVSLAPALARGMDRVSSAILNAFGGDQQRAIQTLVSWVDKFAIAVVRGGELTVTAARVAMQAWSGFQVLFAGVAQGVTSVLGTIVAAQARVFEVLSYTSPALSAFYADAAKRAQALAKELDLTSKAWGLAGKMATQSGYETYKSLVTLEAQMADVRKEMEAAAKQGVTGATVQKALATATEEHGKSAKLTAAELAKLKKEHEQFLKVVEKQIDAIALSNAEVKWAAVYWKQWHQALMPIGLQTLPKITGDTYELAAGLKGVGVQMQFVSSKTHDMARTVEAALDDAEEKARELQDALDDVAAFNATRIVGAFSDIASGFDGLTGTMLRSFTRTFDEMIETSRRNGGKLWEWLQGQGGTKAGAYLATGVQGFTSGYNLGQMTGGPGKGALSGAASGAMAGVPFAAATGGMSILVGAGIGAIGGWLGGRKAQKEQKAALAEIQQDLIATYGSMEKLRKVAQSLGVDIDKAFSSKKPKEALDVINQFEQATQAAAARIEGINLATEGLSLRAASAFGGNLPGLLEQRDALQEAIKTLSGDDLARVQQELDKVRGQLVAIGATGEAEFTRLGYYAVATFAAHLQESGNVVQALSAIEPTLEQLQRAQEAFGFAGSESLQTLLGYRDVVKVNQDVFNSLSGLTQMMQGFGDAGLMTRGLFQTFAEDAGAQFQTLTSRGVDANQALALMAPTLQQLYEGQQKYGTITDETTAGLIEQAKQQGLVGDHMKSVNGQILDAVLGVQYAIEQLADFFKGELPNAAEGAAKDIEGAFKDLRIRIPVEFDRQTLPEGRYEYEGGGEYPGMATGGVVPFTPGGGRLVRMGEREREYAIPESAMRRMTAAPTVNLQFTINGGADALALRDTIRREVVPEIVRAIGANQRGARTQMRYALGVDA